MHTFSHPPYMMERILETKGTMNKEFVVKHVKKDVGMSIKFS